jgi:hypothetical protein
LPADERDLALVLAAGSVLREEADPVLRERVDLEAALPPDLVDLDWQYLGDRLLAAPGQFG